jgi:hypothetical protein
MNLKNLEKYLESFGKYVIKQSRTNLSKAKKNVTKDLYNSLEFRVVKDAGGIWGLEFLMLDYGEYIDKGVSGSQKKRTYKDFTGKKVASPYEYSNKQPPAGILAKWISKRRIKGRDKKTGRFITNLSLAFAMARTIKRDGIKGISFFQRPIELGWKRFGEGVLDSIAKDILDAIPDEIQKNE